MRRVLISKVKYRTGILLLACSDFLILLGLFYLSVLLRRHLIPLLFKSSPPFIFAPAVYYWIFLIWMGVIAYNGGYTRRFTFWDEVKFLWKCTFIVSIAIFTTLFVGKLGDIYSRALILLMSVLCFALLPGIRSQVKKVLYSMGLMKRKILILGAGNTARMALEALRSEDNLGYEVAGFIDDRRHNPDRIENIKIRGFLDRVDRYISMCSIHDVLVAYPEMERGRLVRILTRTRPKTPYIYRTCRA
jgi:undecaprenyl-phosphate galactose phosphotransferase